MTEPAAPPTVPDTIGEVKCMGFRPVSEEPGARLVPVFASHMGSGNLLLTLFKMFNVEISFDTHCLEPFFRCLDLPEEPSSPLQHHYEDLNIDPTALSAAWDGEDEPQADPIPFLKLSEQEAADFRDKFHRSARLFTGYGEGKLKEMKSKPINYSSPMFEEALNSACWKRRTSLVEDYLLGLPPLPDDYSGPTLENWLTMAFGCDDTPFNRWIQASALVGIALRTLVPACLIRAYPVLVGSPDIGKSAIVRHILPPHLRYFHTDEVDISKNSEDLIYPMRGKAVVELSEMRGATKGDAQKIKHFATSTKFGNRLKYERRVTDINFTHMFIGTANHTNTFLPGDKVAAQRFLPIQLRHGCNTEKYMGKWRDSLFRQAVEAAQFIINNESEPMIRVPQEFQQLHETSVEAHRAAAHDEIATEILPNLMGARVMSGMNQSDMVKLLHEHGYKEIRSHMLGDILRSFDKEWEKADVAGKRVWRRKQSWVDANIEEHKQQMEKANATDAADPFEAPEVSEKVIAQETDKEPF